MFSWSDAARAAFTSCLPCLRPDPETPPPAYTDHPAVNHIPRARPNELERLLNEPESTDTEAEVHSLHSHPGDRTRRKRRTKKFTKRITLFGFDLFGRRPPPIQLPDDSNNDLLQAPTTRSSRSYDSDAASLDAADLSRLEALARDEEREAEVRAKEERRRLRHERKERRRLARALAAAAGSSRELEDSQSCSSEAFGRLPDHILAIQPSPISPMSHIAVDDDEEDAADLDGAMYTARRPSSHSGSESRSYTSSHSSRPVESNDQHYSPHVQSWIAPHKSRPSGTQSSSKSRSSGKSSTSDPSSALASPPLLSPVPNAPHRNIRVQQQPPARASVVEQDEFDGIIGLGLGLPLSNEGSHPQLYSSSPSPGLPNPGLLDPTRKRSGISDHGAFLSMK
ncbi:hypothetical protein FISHEDRAFT_55137 [Fistulina hepatica ATCC 64428]|uniref:Uncharacterized protein n=1 Tax=Fistulina hepatica ATCC 64428 TaxID=1128425 RepID=A0A0D7ARQ4_9AGAR|nr:hypothetical protein FISHEDRAFT_55137 [Fistulina hepatica ATCC 64428]